MQKSRRDADKENKDIFLNSKKKKKKNLIVSLVACMVRGQGHSWSGRAVYDTANAEHRQTDRRQARCMFSDTYLLSNALICWPNAFCSLTFHTT